MAKKHSNQKLHNRDSFDLIASNFFLFLILFTKKSYYNYALMKIKNKKKLEVIRSNESLVEMTNYIWSICIILFFVARPSFASACKSELVPLIQTLEILIFLKNGNYFLYFTRWFLCIYLCINIYSIIVFVEKIQLKITS